MGAEVPVHRDSRSTIEKKLEERRIELESWKDKRSLTEDLALLLSLDSLQRALLL